MTIVKKAKIWLNERGIEVRAEFDIEPKEPIVVPNQAHAMIYFDDPDGNRLEFITRLPKEIDQSEKIYLTEWERISYKLLQQNERGALVKSKIDTEFIFIFL